MSLGHSADSQERGCKTEPGPGRVKGLVYDKLLQNLFISRDNEFVTIAFRCFVSSKERSFKGKQVTLGFRFNRETASDKQRPSLDPCLSKISKCGN
jgi:hypothetical protein